MIFLQTKTSLIFHTLEYASITRYSEFCLFVLARKNVFPDSTIATYSVTN